MVVVLDSNIFLSALISPYGPPHRIYEAWEDGSFSVATCREQIDELRRASRYPKLREILKPHLVGKMLNCLQRAEVYERPAKKHVADDPHDAYLLDVAVVSEADYLVTGDKRSGLLKRRRIGRARILSAAQFCEKALG